jgi:hypothetical protein
MTDPFAVIPVRPRKKVPRKCSTCADRQCCTRGKIVDWMHCNQWILDEVKTYKEKAHS